MKKSQRSVPFVFIVYVICFILRVHEYMVIQMDRSIFGEAFIHKLFGIIVITVIIKILSLWLTMADHFVNNTIVNMRHVVINNGKDALLMGRIAITQTVFFLIVLIAYLKNDGRYNQELFQAAQ